MTERPLMSELCPKPSRSQAPSTQPLGITTAPASRGTAVYPEAPQTNTEKLPERSGTNPGKLKEKKRKRTAFKLGLGVTRDYDVFESEDLNLHSVLQFKF